MNDSSEEDAGCWMLDAGCWAQHLISIAFKQKIFSLLAPEGKWHCIKVITPKG
jgi:hypothetical protein